MRNGAKYFRPDNRGDRFPMVETRFNFCRTPRCHGLVEKKSCHSPYCSKCRTRRWNESHPLERAFHNLRSHAKERGKDFSLTVEQFKAFAEKTDYMKRRGKTSLSLSIDRIENALGYHFWNISAIQLASNARKSFVPYFNGGVMPEIDRDKYLELENNYREPLKKIADEIGARVGFGTPLFWKEFRGRKLELYEKDAEQVR